MINLIKNKYFIPISTVALLCVGCIVYSFFSTKEAESSKINSSNTGEKGGGGENDKVETTIGIGASPAAV
ncbi:MAG: hypothetical protein ACJAX4_002994 [Clostridium sp.]